MRKAVLGGVAITVTTVLLSPVQASAIDPVSSAKLREAVTVNGILQHERALQKIATANGGTRTSGTPGFLASAKYVKKKLREAGYKPKVQTFVFPFFKELAPATLTDLGPATPRDIETATFDYSGTGDVTGLLVPTKDVVIPPAAEPSSTSGCEAADFSAAPTPTAIALVQRGTCTFEDKANNAQAAGYAAVVIFNEGQPGRQELLTGTLGAIETIPVVGITFAEGESLYSATKARPVILHVTTSTENDPKRTTKNIIADTPKGKKKGETVVVGAHLDSVPAGPGINDNGSGTATVLEIAEQMAKLKINNKLQRQIRFAFWGAEENGLLGSTHYVSGLSPAQTRDIYANLNFDMLGSPNYVRFVYDGDGSDTGTAGPAGSGAIESIFTDYFDAQKLASAPTEFDGRSDYGPFIDAGIPAGGLFSGAEGKKTSEEAAIYGGTAGAAYDSCYHQACDTTTNLNERALVELGDAAAHAVYVLARSKSGLYLDGSSVGHRRQNSAERQPAHAR